MDQFFRCMYFDEEDEQEGWNFALACVQMCLPDNLKLISSLIDVWPTTESYIKCKINQFVPRYLLAT